MREGHQGVVSACRLIESNEPAPRERRLNPPVTEWLNDSVVSRAVTSAKKKKRGLNSRGASTSCTSYNSFAHNVKFRAYPRG